MLDSNWTGPAASASEKSPRPHGTCPTTPGTLVSGSSTSVHAPGQPCVTAKVTASSTTSLVSGLAFGRPVRTCPAAIQLR
eukprot:15465332-Alexandrium_andersonii.AAC.1